MKLSFTVFSLFFFFFFLALLQHGVQGETLEENCKKIVKPDLSFDFCMKIFQADPKSKSADLQGLGIISLKQTVTNVAYIQSYVQKLLASQGKGGDNKFTSALHRCVSAYNEGVDYVNEALHWMESKHYANSGIAMSSAKGVPIECEDAFSEFKSKSPLTQLNDEFHQLALIPYHIANLLDL